MNTWYIRNSMFKIDYLIYDIFENKINWSDIGMQRSTETFQFFEGNVFDKPKVSIS